MAKKHKWEGVREMKRTFREQINICELNGNLRRIDILPHVETVSNNYSPLLKKLRIALCCGKYKTICKSNICQDERELGGVKFESQPLPWTKEKPTKPCVVVTRQKVDGKNIYYQFDINNKSDLRNFEGYVFADEYLILEEL
jgi:hypothetical protein